MSSAMAGPGGDSQGAIYRLRLFVAGEEANTRQARANLQRLCEECLAGRVEVEIVDVLKDFRAKGFDPSMEFAGHLGLRVMRERAQQLGGTLTITSAPRAGTAVIARVPLTPS